MRHFILLMAIACSLQLRSQTDTLQWKALIRSSDWKTYSSVKDLDPQLLKKFPEWKRMSSRNGRFEATDVGTGPRRRLYFAANYRNYWIVSYEHGGIGYHTHCMFIEITANGFNVYHSYNTFGSLAELQRQGALFMESWNEYDY